MNNNNNIEDIIEALLAPEWKSLTDCNELQIFIEGMITAYRRLLVFNRGTDTRFLLEVIEELEFLYQVLLYK